jgi:hypothetical protein
MRQFNSTKNFVLRRRFLDVRTFLSTTDSGKSNSPTMQSGIAPPHGFALSIFRSKNTVSIFFSCAKISAAQAPDGPPPTTATLYFISNMVVDDDEALVGNVIGLPTKLDDIVKAEADTTSEEIAASENFMVYYTDGPVVSLYMYCSKQ